MTSASYGGGKIVNLLPPITVNKAVHMADIGCARKGAVRLRSRAARMRSSWQLRCLLAWRRGGVAAQRKAKSFLAFADATLY